MDAGGQLTELLGAIDAQERVETQTLERAYQNRDALSRARAALRSVVPSIPIPESVVMVPVSSFMPPPIPPAPPSAPPEPAHESRPPRHFKRRKPAPKPKHARAARARKPKPESAPLAPVVIAAPMPGPDAAAGPEPEPARKRTDDIMAVAQDNAGQPIDVLARMVMEKRKERGAVEFKKTRGRIYELVKSGRLHKNPDGAVSA